MVLHDKTSFVLIESTIEKSCFMVKNAINEVDNVELTSFFKQTN